MRTPQQNKENAAAASSNQTTAKGTPTEESVNEVTAKSALLKTVNGQCRIQWPCILFNLNSFVEINGSFTCPKGNEETLGFNGKTRFQRKSGLTSPSFPTPKATK